MSKNQKMKIIIIKSSIYNNPYNKTKKEIKKNY